MWTIFPRSSLHEKTNFQTNHKTSMKRLIFKPVIVLYIKCFYEAMNNNKTWECQVLSMFTIWDLTLGLKVFSESQKVCTESLIVKAAFELSVIEKSLQNQSK